MNSFWETYSNKVFPPTLGNVLKSDACALWLSSAKEGQQMEKAGIRGVFSPVVHPCIFALARLSKPGHHIDKAGEPFTSLCAACAGCVCSIDSGEETVSSCAVLVSRWLLLLFHEVAAVPIAVHKAKHGRNVVPSKPLQSPGVPTSTAEYSVCGKRTQMDGEAMCRKARQEACSRDFLLCLLLVGVRGFEPPTTSTPLKCATGLRYTPSGDVDRW
jgi:hypothetical protein